jgi:hypothetical protein
MFIPRWKYKIKIIINCYIVIEKLGRVTCNRLYVHGSIPGYNHCLFSSNTRLPHRAPRTRFPLGINQEVIKPTSGVKG